MRADLAGHHCNERVHKPRIERVREALHDDTMRSVALPRRNAARPANARCASSRSSLARSRSTKTTNAPKAMTASASIVICVIVGIHKPEGLTSSSASAQKTTALNTWAKVPLFIA